MEISKDLSASRRSSVRTPTAPTAEAIGKHRTLPLLIVFQKAGGASLGYVTMSARSTVTSRLKVPHIQSTNGTAINPGALAAQALARAARRPQ